MVNTFSVNVLIYLDAVQYSASNAEFGYESEWDNAESFFVNLVKLIKKFYIQYTNSDVSKLFLLGSNFIIHTLSQLFFGF